MKKYLQDAGYKFIAHYDDLTDKQFSLDAVTFSDSEQKTFNNMVLDRVEVYSLFLKAFEAVAFSTKIETALGSAISDGVNVSDGTDITVENVENGYNITLSFEIKG
jgi:hypothetical protein